METITCARCEEPEAPRLEKPPFKTDLGGRIQEQICQNCWKDWLQHQTLLINHYGLDPRDPKARKFLYKQVEAVLLGEGDEERADIADIDTSKEGSIEW